MPVHGRSSDQGTPYDFFQNWSCMNPPRWAMYAKSHEWAKRKKGAPDSSALVLLWHEHTILPGIRKESITVARHGFGWRVSSDTKASSAIFEWCVQTGPLVRSARKRKHGRNCKNQRARGKPALLRPTKLSRKLAYIVSGRGIVLTTHKGFQTCFPGVQILGALASPVLEAQLLPFPVWWFSGKGGEGEGTRQFIPTIRWIPTPIPSGSPTPRRSCTSWCRSCRRPPRWEL